MANRTLGVDEGHDTIGGIAVADRPSGAHSNVLPALRKAGIFAAGIVRSGVRNAAQPRPDFATDADVMPVATDETRSWRAVGVIAVGRGPIAGMGVDPRTALVYVANHVDDSVSVLDPVGRNVVMTVEGTPEPFAVAVAGGRACVSSVVTPYDMVSVIESGGVSGRNVPLAHSVRDIAVSPGGRHLYAARNAPRGPDVAVIDTTDGRVTKVNPKTRAGAAAEAVAVSPDGRRIYLATADDLGGELVAIDTVTRRVVGGLGLPWPSRDVVVSPDGTTVFVASCDPAFGGVVDIVDARTLRVVDSVDVGGVITELVASADGGRLYVATGHRVSVLCTFTREIVEDITLVADPSCIAESADGKQLFIADYQGTVTMLGVPSGETALSEMASDVIDIPMIELEYAGA